jgi:hypothetical protein
MSNPRIEARKLRQLKAIRFVPRIIHRTGTKYSSCTQNSDPMLMQQKAKKTHPVLLLL